MRISWPASALILAMMGGSVVCAHAQSVTTFDGTYNGVKATASGSAGPLCDSSGFVPRPLTIRGGAAQYNAGLTGAFHYQGTVTAGGNLILRDNNGRRIDAHIDQTGKITGGFSGIYCSVYYTWQKQ